MPRIEAAFKKRKALITFITAGDPSLSATEKLVFQLEKAGADIIELGIPFSDPLADGPVIQASHQRALKKDVALADVFKLVAKARKKTQIPICFMLSYNLVLKYGAEQFYADCDKCGVDGVIIPDLPPEENGLARILLVAPTTNEERIKKIADASTGFIYLISVAGVTGKRTALSQDVAFLVAKIKKYSSKPVAVGFGITTPAQAKEVTKHADGVIVGSAIVDLIAQKKIPSALKLVAKMRRALDA